MTKEIKANAPTYLVGVEVKVEGECFSWERVVVKHGRVVGRPGHPVGKGNFRHLGGQLPA